MLSLHSYHKKKLTTKSFYRLFAWKLLNSRSYQSGENGKQDLIALSVSNRSNASHSADKHKLDSRISHAGETTARKSTDIITWTTNGFALICPAGLCRAGFQRFVVDRNVMDSAAVRFVAKFSVPPVLPRGY